MKNKRINKKTNYKKKLADSLKCDFCGKRGKIYTRKNYPHGRKSKPIITYICKECRKKQ